MMNKPFCRRFAVFLTAVMLLSMISPVYANENSRELLGEECLLDHSHEDGSCGFTPAKGSLEFVIDDVHTPDEEQAADGDDDIPVIDESERTIYEVALSDESFLVDGKAELTQTDKDAYDRFFSEDRLFANEWVEVGSDKASSRYSYNRDDKTLATTVKKW